MASSPPPPSGKPPLPLSSHGTSQSNNNNHNNHHRARSISADGSSSVIAKPQHISHVSNKKRSTASSAASDTLAERAELGLLSHIEGRRSHVRLPGSGDLWYSSVEGERPPLPHVSHAGALALEQDQQQQPQRHVSFGSIGTSHSADGSTTTSTNNNKGNTTTAPQHLRDMARRVVVGMNRTSSFGSSTNSNGNASSKHKRGASRAHAFLGMIQSEGADSKQPTPTMETTSEPSSSSTALHSTENSKRNDHEDESSTPQQPQHYNRNGNKQQQQHKRSNTTTSSSSIESGLFDSVGGDAHLEQGDSLFSVEGTNTDRLFSGAFVVNNLFETISEEGDAGEEHHNSTNGGTENTHHGNNTKHKRRHASAMGSSETVPLVGTNNNDPNDPSLYGSSASTTSTSTLNSNNKRLARKKRGTQWQKFCEGLATFFNPTRWGQALVHIFSQAYFLWASIPIFFVSWILVFSLDNPTFNFLPGNAISLAWWVNLLGRLCLTLEMARLVQWLWIDHVILGTRAAARCLGPLLTLVTIQGRGWPFVVTTWSMINLFLLHGRHQFQKNWLLFITFGFDNTKGENYINILESGEYVRLWMALIVAGLVTSAKRTVVAMYFGRRTFTEFKPRLEKLLKEVVLISEVSELALEIDRNVGHPDSGDTFEVELTGADRKVKFLDMSWSSDPQLQNRTRTDSQQLESDDESEATQLTDREKHMLNGKLHSGQSDRSRFSSGKAIPFKDLLEYWEEPINKMDRSMNASIQDILKFRRALTFMDEPYPFGEAFGPATTRDEVLESASHTYQRLLGSSEHSVLSCEVLYLLAEDEDGTTVDKGKKRNIRKLFHPDAESHVSGLSFVQACDSLYRRMRYFRASVGNASVIDHALESIVDGFYHFILCLVMLSILQINPWPLLVSISTLLVSVSFAVGPSAAKYIEGILLIAIRRPFDLGDRIYMHEPSVWNSDNGLDCSWFVEDINLFNTTIRYAATNEVATLSNGSIAHMRIVNGNRSPNAMVWFRLPFNLSVLEEEKMASLRASLEAYARLHPHKWHSCAYCRADEFHPDKEKVIITIGFQARSSWQDLPRIYMLRSELTAATVEYARRQGINYEELPRRVFQYKAGTLRKGGVWKHRAALHAAENIISNDDQSPTAPGGDEEALPLATSSLLRHEMPLNGEDGKSGELSRDALFLSRLQESH